jgi:hypothetical protein
MPSQLHPFIFWQKHKSCIHINAIYSGDGPCLMYSQMNIYIFVELKTFSKQMRDFVHENSPCQHNVNHRKLELSDF